MSIRCPISLKQPPSPLHLLPTGHLQPPSPCLTAVLVVDSTSKIVVHHLFSFSQPGSDQGSRKDPKSGLHTRGFKGSAHLRSSRVRVGGGWGNGFEQLLFEDVGLLVGDLRNGECPMGSVRLRCSGDVEGGFGAGMSLEVLEW
ncbi:hypothetical protein V6N11_027215 [Hibiscus sabdariffa]|uniref:Uncharacterized protein n=1 Tax=Hibiscus sabdariffa TaxID=183260 RepID=A0ABR2PG99_9ROSI